MKLVVPQEKMIVAIKNTRTNYDLAKIKQQAFHFFEFCCFLICCNSFSSSSTEIFFSFTIKETTLLNEPSKYPFTTCLIVRFEYSSLLTTGKYSCCLPNTVTPTNSFSIKIFKSVA